MPPPATWTDAQYARFFDAWVKGIISWEEFRYNPDAVAYRRRKAGGDPPAILELPTRSRVRSPGTD